MGDPPPRKRSERLRDVALGPVSSRDQAVPR
jgi:hypothetical protein